MNTAGGKRDRRFVDVIHLLKITRKLRYYPKDFIQEFMAEATSFLLRNAPTEQLRKDIMKLLLDVARNLSQLGVSSVLWQTMRGSSSKFHSRARTVLAMLISSYVLNIQDSKNKVSDEDNSNVNAPSEGSKSMIRSSEELELFELYHSYIQVKMYGRSFIVVVPLLLQASQKIPFASAIFYTQQNRCMLGSWWISSLAVSSEYRTYIFKQLVELLVHGLS